MPFSVGGGVTTLNQIQQLLEAGAERVVLGSVAARNPAFVCEASNRFGKSSIVVCVDIKRSWLGKNGVVFCNGKHAVKANLIEYAKMMEINGAGELIIQSVDRDGTYHGLDQHVLSEISNELSIPITGMGGLSSLNEITSVHKTLKLNGYGAGSLFVFQSKNQGVLVNYPSQEELQSLF